MSQTIYGVPGSFCWAELYTRDENKSKDFYAKVFSWNYSESKMDEHSHYTHAMIASGAVAGMVEINDELKKQGVSPHWASYIAVTDIHKTVDAAQKLGAQIVLPPMDIPHAGCMAILKDPTDAFFSLWQSHAQREAPARNAHGMVGWNELLTTDINTAKRFYTSVFGWGVHEENVNGHAYVSFTENDKYVAGMMQIEKEMGPIPSHWSVYFTTDNIEASRKIIQAEGGVLLSPVMDLPNIGTMVAIKDPSDAVFSLFQWAQK